MLLVDFMNAADVSANVKTLLALDTLGRTGPDSGLDFTGSFKGQSLEVPMVQNAEEVAANKGYDELSATRQHKSDVGLYGVNQVAGALTVNPSSAEHFAFAALVQLTAEVPTVELSDISSRAKSIVFTDLG